MATFAKPSCAYRRLRGRPKQFLVIGEGDHNGEHVYVEALEIGQVGMSQNKPPLLDLPNWHVFVG